MDVLNLILMEPKLMASYTTFRMVCLQSTPGAIHAYLGKVGRAAEEHDAVFQSMLASIQDEFSERDLEEILVEHKAAQRLLSDAMSVYPIRMFRELLRQKKQQYRGEKNSLGQQVDVVENMLALASYAHLGQESWLTILGEVVLSPDLLFLTDEDRMKVLGAMEGPGLHFESGQCRAIFRLLGRHTRPLSANDSQTMCRAYSTALHACSGYLIDGAVLMDIQKQGFASRLSQSLKPVSFISGEQVVKAAGALDFVLLDHMVAKRQLVVLDGFFRDMVAAALQAGLTLQQPDSGPPSLEAIGKCWGTYRVLRSMFGKAGPAALNEALGKLSRSIIDAALRAKYLEPIGQFAQDPYLLVDRLSMQCKVTASPEVALYLSRVIEVVVSMHGDSREIIRKLYPSALDLFTAAAIKGSLEVASRLIWIFPFSQADLDGVRLLAHERGYSKIANLVARRRAGIFRLAFGSGNRDTAASHIPADIQGLIFGLLDRL